MNHKQTLGKKGEDLAVRLLKGKNYHILERNWRSGRDEVDIIAEMDNFLVFVEVKTRSSAYFGEPQEFVTKQKLQFMIRAANNYLEEKQRELEIRFDIISVILSKNKEQIKHIPDAFNALIEEE